MYTSVVYYILNIAYYHGLSGNNCIRYKIANISFTYLFSEKDDYHL